VAEVQVGLAHVTKVKTVTVFLVLEERVVMVEPMAPQEQLQRQVAAVEHRVNLQGLVAQVQVAQVVVLYLETAILHI
jgi:hypothetical protein